MEWRQIGLFLVFLAGAGIGLWAVRLWWNTGEEGLELVEEVKSWPVVEATVEETELKPDTGPRRRTDPPWKRRKTLWLKVRVDQGGETRHLRLPSPGVVAVGDRINLRVNPADPTDVVVDNAVTRAGTKAVSWVVKGAAVLFVLLFGGALILGLVIKLGQWRSQGIWQDGGTTLHLEGTDLSAVEVDFAEHPQIERAELAHTQLTELPSDLLRLPALRDLDLSWNQIGSLPETLGESCRLERLDLSGNPLGRVPEAVLAQRELRELRMDRTGLTELPPELGNLSKLEILSLQNNELRTLPRTLGQLRSLRWLFLTGNPLEEAPAWLEDLPALTRLNLGGEFTPEEKEALRARLPHVEIYF